MEAKILVLDNSTTWAQKLSRNGNATTLIIELGFGWHLFYLPIIVQSVEFGSQQL